MRRIVAGLSLIAAAGGLAPIYKKQWLSRRHPLYIGVPTGGPPSSG
jgi:hypothetical protein